MHLNETIVEDVVLEWFGELDYAVRHGAKQFRTPSTLLTKPRRGELRGAATTPKLETNKRAMSRCQNLK